MSNGYADFYGFHPASSGWFVCGWAPIDRALAEAAPYGGTEATVVFDGTLFTTRATAVVFDREDLKGEGVGFVLFARRTERITGRLLWIEIMLGQAAYRLNVVAATVQLRETELASRLRMVLGSAFAGQRAELTALLGRRGYAGANTVDALSDTVRLGIDDAILCGTDGLLIQGWLLAAPGTILSIALCCDGTATAMERGKFLPISRRDVSNTVGAPLGIDHEHCGFLAFVKTEIVEGAPVYLQIETRSQEVGFMTLAPRRAHGLAPIRKILEAVDAEFEAVQQVLRDVVGPAVQRLNTERLRAALGVTETTYGAPPAAPSCSLIVPLHGRIDYLEYQMALMSSDPETLSLDIIYVLDDPPRRREAQLLAESAYARFRVPFRLLILDENRGFAPANNLGLARARAEYVCFLNSDVFPTEGGWLGRLCADLAENPDIGAVGGLLLFEDGSVQHEGMRFEPIPIMGGLHFPIHVRKGWRPRRGAGLERTSMITGACMTMATSLARELLGFDEAYVIGDFEDCDLCARIGAMGKTCAVDHGVRLHHLERKSQVSPDKRWRRNLTLYNAWVHENRWFPPTAASGAGR